MPPSRYEYRKYTWRRGQETWDPVWWPATPEEIQDWLWSKAQPNSMGNFKDFDGNTIRIERTVRKGAVDPFWP